MNLKVDVVTRGIIDATYRENGNKCLYTLAKGMADSFVQGVQILRKNSPYTPAINQQYVNQLL